MCVLPSMCQNPACRSAQSLVRSEISCIPGPLCHFSNFLRMCIFILFVQITIETDYQKTVARNLVIYVCFDLLSFDFSDSSLNIQFTYCFCYGAVIKYIVCMQKKSEFQISKIKALKQQILFVHNSKPQCWQFRGTHISMLQLASLSEKVDIYYCKETYV